jgi:hypothetical protein
MRTFLEYILLKQNSEQFQSLINTIYNEIVKTKKLNHIDLENHFYHFLTGGSQGIGFTQYQIKKINKEDFVKFQETYQKIKKSWQIGSWRYREGSSYEYFFAPKSKKLDDNHNFKRYITLSEPKSKEMEKFDILLNKLANIESINSVKIPVFAKQLISGIDNIVIYYANMKDAYLIDKLIIESKINEANRSQYFRSNHGVDKIDNGQMKSDTELASKFYVNEFKNWINQTSFGITKLSNLRTIKEEEAKNQISNILNLIFRKQPQHRII